MKYTRRDPAMPANSFSYKNSTLTVFEDGESWVSCAPVSVSWQEDGGVTGSYHLGTDLRAVRAFCEILESVGRKIATIKVEDCTEGSGPMGSRVFEWTQGALKVKLGSTYGARSGFNPPIVFSVQIEGREIWDLTDLEVELNTLWLRPLPQPH